jgi:hypothetical protein
MAKKNQPNLFRSKHLEKAGLYLVYEKIRKKDSNPIRLLGKGKIY